MDVTKIVKILKGIAAGMAHLHKVTMTIFFLSKSNRKA
jgi:hypothetical protein